MANHLSYKEPLAKPSGITLAQHTADVMAEALCLCQMIPSSIVKYQNMVHKSLPDRLRLVAEYHDKGKTFVQWQDACVKDYQAYMLWKHKHPNTNFSDYSKSCPNEAGKYLRKSGVRHEFHSLAEAYKAKMPNSLLAAIAAHHVKLSYDAEERWNNFPVFWKLLKGLSNGVIETNNLEKICKHIFEYNGLRGLLQLADHRASAKEEREYTAVLREFSYIFPFSQKRGIQELVEREYDKDMLLVRAPTGAGKTDAALLWASKQIDACKADRLIIAMPTRFTANALAINVSESLSGTGIYHSSAWLSKYQEIKDETVSSEEALSAHKMARLLAAPVTVTTIDHLLMSLTQTREDHHLINFNLANSCVVIDEADFYDDFTLANIQFLLRVLKKWNVPVLVMSASIPDSALSFYKKTGYNVESILEDDAIDKSIEKFEIKQIIPYEETDELNTLLRECFRHGSGIIYMNTVDKAIDVYNLAQRIKEEEKTDVPIFLYHSRFTEPDKAAKETQLINALGKEAWKKGTAIGIAILTQIGEISINISTDFMISDLCPIDRLMQRVGRLCRFDNRKGELHVILPQKQGALYPAPYGCFCNKTWTASIALSKTLKYLHNGSYTEDDLLKALNSVYDTSILISDKAKTNAETLQDMFICNWLINPIEKNNEEECDTNLWKSRDIGPQDVVFTKRPNSCNFTNYSDFMNYRLQNSLAIPLYLLGKLQNKIDIKTIYIANDIRKIYVLREGFYNNEIGLKFSESIEDKFL